MEVFVDKCNEYFEHDKQILTELKKREAIQFPIADSHDAVGITHGMLLCTNNTWRFYDFGSHNKTSIQSEQGSQDIDGVLAVRPGDILRLGATKMAHDANVFWSAAAMHVSRYVERERELYV